MRTLILSFFLLLSLGISAQTSISGRVITKKGLPIQGANIYISGTYDGSSSGEEGRFQFNTSEIGKLVLLVSYLGFDTYQIRGDVEQLSNLKIILKEDLNSLETVVLTAGTFSVGGNNKLSALKPIDILTTANAVGDFIAAFQTLPGTSTVAEDGRLFVRGGDASETQVFIDGIRVFTPYSSSANNTPSRGRFSPLLFDGISLSTGGYSAEYGQALSSVLLLNTIEEEVQEKTDISIMTLGGGIGHTKKWKTNSLSINTSYINLGAYKELFQDRNEWQKPVVSVSGEAIFRQRIGSGLLKFYTAFETTSFDLTQVDINEPEGIAFKLNNQNYYTNLSFTNVWNRGWSIFAGASYTNDRALIDIQKANIKDVEQSMHFKLKLRKNFSNNIKWTIGAEQFVTDFKENYYYTPNKELEIKYQYPFNVVFPETEDLMSRKLTLKFQDPLTAFFTEAAILFSKSLILNIGIRGEYSNLLQKATLSPRASIAYKTTKNSQVSFAYGNFYQQPEKEILKYYSDLKAANAQHYILNYQYSFKQRLFRAEVYRKDYQNLISYSDSKPSINSHFATDGKGYAQGLDVFYRDNNGIKNVDYWISYSYLDTKRKYKNYPQMSRPSFTNKHNLSVVAKYWMAQWKSQIGFSYQYASGRTYTDLNTTGFLQSKTKSFNSLSLNWAYLLSPQKILYASVSNVLGLKNINGYQYAHSPNLNGVHKRQVLRPAMDQFFFIGYFWTLSSDKKANQLKNL